MKDFPIYNVSFKLLNENFSFFCKKDRLKHIFICLRCFLLSSWVISEGCIFQKYCSLSFSCYSKGTHPFWITWFSKKNPKLKITCKNLFDKEIKVQYYAHQSKGIPSIKSVIFIQNRPDFSAFVFTFKGLIILKKMHSLI